MRTTIRTALAAGAVVAAMCAGVAFAAESAAVQTPTAPQSDAFASYNFQGYDRLVSDTAFLDDVLGYNPHGSHMGEIDNCARCHGTAEDGGNVLWCTSCHIGMTLPDGWQDAPVVP